MWTHLSGQFIETTTTIEREVVELSQAEKDAKADNNSDKTAETFVNIHKDNGQEEARHIFMKLKRYYNEGNLTENQYKNIKDQLFDILIPLDYGQWDIAQTRILAITPPVNQRLLNVYNYVKNRIDTYVTTHNL